MNTFNVLAEPNAAAPIAVSVKVQSSGRRNSGRRQREFLTPKEIDQLRRVARRSGRTGRYSRRNEALIMLMAAHGLRVSEAVALHWDQVDFGSSSEGARLYVKRRKNGMPSTHTLCGPEIRALRLLRREWPDSPHLFSSERGGPMTTSNVRKGRSHSSACWPSFPFLSTPTCFATPAAIGW